MDSQWQFTGESTALRAPGNVTLVEGSTFCISNGAGDIAPTLAHGLFFVDSRMLSCFAVRINGEVPEPLANAATDPFSAEFVARTRPVPGLADSSLVVMRSRYVGDGMREDFRIRNFSDEVVRCSIEINVDVDFASLFDVKEGRFDVRRDRTISVDGSAIRFHQTGVKTERAVRVDFCNGAPPVSTVEDNGARALFEVDLPARGEWSTCIQLTPAVDGNEIEPTNPCGKPVGRAAPSKRMTKWRRDTPILATDYQPLREMVMQGLEDLGALRIFDPEHPKRAVVAAGAPWFMALFGRDSLLTAWMALLADPDLALGVLHTLARFQGERVDPETEEEPGRILHELRFVEAASSALGHGHPYYGSADSTPLFVMLLGELRRWGLARAEVDRLLPHADRALEWITTYGDRDGDGYVEYERKSERGLENQGWKDSWDAVRHLDGSLAKPPIAMAEVQGYVYGAYLARHHFAVETGDAAVAEHWRERALALREAFNRDFWVADKGWYAMALDRDKRPVAALASNMGHCLWTGLIPPDRAAIVAKRLLSRQMFSGWGIRTFASSMVGYNPIGYHTGSIWPHDNAIIAAGLMRYGFVKEAERVIMALLEAGAASGWRLPELFSGLDRKEFPTVVSYPASCVPQAWASASPLMFLRTLLRLDPWVPYGKLWVAPTLPAGVGYLRVDRIPVAKGRMSIEVDRDGARVSELPPGLDLIRSPRYSQSAV